LSGLCTPHLPRTYTRANSALRHISGFNRGGRRRRRRRRREGRGTQIVAIDGSSAC